MERLSKKEMRDQYKERRQSGGVVRIYCKADGSGWFRSTPDISGMKNRLLFSVKTDMCPEPCMASAWKQFGASSFEMEVLEEIQRGETQSPQEFREDIRALWDMWKEKSQEK